MLDTIFVAFALAALSAAPIARHGEPPTGPGPESTPIIVRPAPTESERREELRDFTKQIVRPPRMSQPVAKFFYPICVQVLGLDPADAEAIAERMRENGRALGVGADADPDCVPTVKVAFMAPAAGPPESWLKADSPMLAHLASYQRERVLTESGPVRAWNRIVVRDFNGRPQVVGQITFIDPPPKSKTDPIITTEITGAAVLIAREAADGFTLSQLADYATMRTLIGTGAPAADASMPADTIMSLFRDPDPPAELTPFDRAMVSELYNASRNSSARRVYNDIAAAAVRSEAKGRDAAQ